MTRIWYVFWHTYWEHVRRPGFYLVIFLVPALIFVVPVLFAAVVVFVIGSVLPPSSDLPVGVIDETGLVLPLGDDWAGRVYYEYESQADGLLIWQFATPLEAEMLLRLGQIQAYFRLPADMVTTGEIFARYNPETPPHIFRQTEVLNWLQARVQGEVNEPLRARLLAGSEMVHVPVVREVDTAVSPPSDETAPEPPPENISRPGDATAGFGILLMVLYFSRMMSIFTSGFMYESVREESQNRTIEILLTTIPAGSLVGGKILGMLAVGVTQLAVFSILPLLFLWWVSQAAAQNPNLAALWPSLPWGVFFLFIAGGYVLDQMVAASTGLLRISGGAGPQVANVLGWLGMAGLIYAITLVPNNPDTPLAVIASLIPFTAPIVVPTRLAFTEVPLWQTAVSLTLLWGSSLLAVWLLSRLVKRNLVGYSDRFRFFRWLRAKWQARRGARQVGESV